MFPACFTECSKFISLTCAVPDGPVPRAILHIHGLPRLKALLNVPEDWHPYQALGHTTDLDWKRVEIPTLVLASNYVVMPWLHYGADLISLAVAGLHGEA